MGMHLRSIILIMLLHIEPNLSIGDLKEHFEECHPTLRMQVFTGMKAYRNGHPAPDQSLLRELTRGHDSGIVDVKSWHLAGATRDLLHQQYGLVVEFYLRQDRTWTPIPANQSFAGAEQLSEPEEVTGSAGEEEEPEGY